VSLFERSALSMGVAGLVATVLLVYGSMVLESHASSTVDVQMDGSIGSLASQVITAAERQGSETVLYLGDGRTIVVRGYKGHHFYERRAK
jgi:hypothetical protein